MNLLMRIKIRIMCSLFHVTNDLWVALLRSGEPDVKAHKTSHEIYSWKIHKCAFETLLSNKKVNIMGTCGIDFFAVITGDTFLCWNSCQNIMTLETYVSSVHYVQNWIDRFAIWFVLYIFGNRSVMMVKLQNEAIFCQRNMMYLLLKPHNVLSLVGCAHVITEKRSQ